MKPFTGVARSPEGTKANSRGRMPPERSPVDASPGGAEGRRVGAETVSRVRAASLVAMAAALVMTSTGCDRGSPSTRPASTGDFIATMNRARAHFMRRESEQAVAAMREALAMRPDSYVANFDFALVSAVTDPAKPSVAKMEQSIPILERLLKMDPDNRAALYLAGLAHNLLDENEKALPLLERAVEGDPQNPIVRYQYARALQKLRRYPDAAEQYYKVIDLDRYLSLAYYQLTQVLKFEPGFDLDSPSQAYRDAEQNMNWLRGSEKAAGLSEPNVVHCEYTRFLDPPSEQQPDTQTIDLKFSNATVEAGFRIDGKQRDVLPCCLIPDATGRISDLLIGDMMTSTVSVMSVQAGRLALSKGSFLPPTSTHAIFADTKEDITRGSSASAPGELASQPAREQGTQPPGESTSVMERPEIFVTGPGGSALVSFDPNDAPVVRMNAFEPEPPGGSDAAWIDVEHDGDVDLLMAGNDGAPRLYQNNGDGLFADVTPFLAWQPGTEVRRVAGADINQDDKVDLLFCGDSNESVILLGQGLGMFSADASGRRSYPAATAMAVDDFDNDGRPDIALAGSPDIVILTQSLAVRETLPIESRRVYELAPVDYDNDGWLDLVAVIDRGDTVGLQLWRNVGERGWQDVSQVIGVVDIAFQRQAPSESYRISAGDLDGDADTDLIVGWQSGVMYLRNDGGNANRQMKVQLVGTRSNRAGIGARVDVRDGTFRASRVVSRMPLEIGIGPRDKVSNVEVVWPNGVTDALVGASPAQPARILETQTEVGSCPYLYAWDGRGFRFVTDILGNSPLGLPLQRGQMIPADTDEYVWVGCCEEFPPLDGRLRVVVTDELREVLYLDKVGLLAVDRPPEMAVASTDALRPPPFPPSEVASFSRLRSPLQALDSDGNDVTELLVSVDDRKTAPLRMRPPQLRGLAEPHSLALDFGPMDGMSRPALILTGWLQYGDGSVNISAEQNAWLPNPSPVLEVELSDGNWRAVDANLSLPAGKTKTIFYDLTEHLPVGSRRLRLTTGFQVYWDRISLGEMLPDAPVARTWLAPVRADLQFRGFSRRVRPTCGHPSTPIFDEVSPRPGWKRTLEGWCTRYGDVLPLVMDVDDQYLILNGGDAVTIDFDPAGLPPLRPGYVRDFFFFSDGWDKDSDHNVTAGDTVEPLPYHGQDDQLYGRDPQGLKSAEWMFRYNTRWVGAEAAEVGVRGPASGARHSESGVAE